MALRVFSQFALEVPGLQNVTMHYDSHGRLDHLAQGSRTWDYTYDALGQLTSVTNQLGDTTLYDLHDGAGRVKSLRLPGQRQVRFGYDAGGNLDSLTTPNNTTHTFGYTPVNLNETYSPPPVAGGPNPSTSYAYDPDHLLKQVTRPDGGIVDLTYHVTNAQLERVEFPSAGSTTPRWRVDYSYGNGPASAGTPKGLLQKADRIGMAAVEYRYDGSLPTQEQWTGRVQGTVARTYDAFFRPATDVVSAGGTSRAVGYGYDDDGLLTGIGASDNSWSYALHRRDSTVMLDSTHVAPSGTGVAVTSSADYDGYGDLTNLRYSVGGAELFQQSIHHDARGRVDEISERWSGGTPRVTHYGYDAAGRLATVTENSVLRREYEYDANGNRTKETRRDGLGSVEVVSVGAYDAQDRLLTYGTGAGVPEEGLAAGDSLVLDGYHAYAYTANGELTSRTLHSPGTTGLAGTYTYDAMGALVAAGRPAAGGTDSVTFALDGQHRRVAEFRDGEFERGWLYEGIPVVAELSDSATLSHRFVYGSRDHVPDLMWDADSAIAYRLVTDHLGSVRAVVRLSDGAVVQRTDYDAWGEVTAETNATLQSLGFAGGLHERTTGLVRFGARDYDATVGRWTSKDPAGFGGGAASFYEYAHNSPATEKDPLGRRTYTEQETKKILRKARREASGAGGPARALRNHARPGLLDYKKREPNSKFCLDGRLMSADEFGNFIAGYAGYHTLGGAGIEVVVAGGWWFNRFEDEPNDDEDSRPDIEAGYEYAAYEEALERAQRGIRGRPW